MQPARWHLYLVSFVEGASLMAVELIGAKLVTPHFGNSIYVWAAALGFTLLGLMCGYFIGGYLSLRYPSRKLLYWITLASGLLVALMPLVASGLVAVTNGLELRLSVIICEIGLLFPPVLLFGTVSPMIIRLIATELAQVGQSAGRIYTISTVGGVALNFLAGLYLIPFLGLRASAWLTAAALVTTAGTLLLLHKSPIKTA